MERIKKMESIDQETRQPAVIAGCVVIMGLSAIAVVLRIISRRASKSSLWYDDYLIITALLAAWGVPIAVLVG